MTNVESMDYTHSHPSTFASLSNTAHLSPVVYTHHIPSSNDRGKGVPSFDEMMNIALMEVDFDDPTTNVRGRRALAIAKPTPRGY